MKLMIRNPSTGIGFFPGLAKPRELDLAGLPSGVRERLRRLAGAVLDQKPAAPEGPDALVYDIALTDDAGETVRARSPHTSAMADLLAAFDDAWPAAH